MTKRKKNSISLKAIGEAIKKAREDENILISEVRDNANVTYGTISQIENGGDIHLSRFLKICFALDVHPKDLLNIDFDVTLKGPSAIETKKNKATARIDDLIKSNYFEGWRTTGEVVKTLNKDHPAEVKSNNISSTLARFHVKGKLLKRKKENSRLNEFKKA